MPTKINNADDLIKFHEGYEEGLYLDSQKYITCGYGHCLDWTRKYESVKEYHEAMFAKHMELVTEDYEKLGLDLDDVRKAAVFDLIYNMGYTKFTMFKKTLIALRMKDYLQAAHQLEQSLWFKQVGRRGPRICVLIREGKWTALD